MRRHCLPGGINRPEHSPGEHCAGTGARLPGEARHCATAADCGAHIDAERELEAAHAPEAHVLTSTFLQRAHGSLYGRLASADRMSPNERVIQPGTLRQEDVTVGRHHPPGYASVPAFLARADDVYGQATGLDSLLYTIAAAHHRFAWVHPFLDGERSRMPAADPPRITSLERRLVVGEPRVGQAASTLLRVARECRHA